MQFTSTVPLLLTLTGVYLTTFYSYLLFHGLAEVFSIVIACGIFMVGWNTRRFIHSHYLLFIGITYLFVAGIDLLHTFSFPLKEWESSRDTAPASPHNSG